MQIQFCWVPRKLFLNLLKIKLPLAFGCCVHTCDHISYSSLTLWLFIPMFSQRGLLGTDMAKLPSSVHPFLHRRKQYREYCCSDRDWTVSCAALVVRTVWGWCTIFKEQAGWMQLCSDSLECSERVWEASEEWLSEAWGDSACSIIKIGLTLN